LIRHNRKSSIQIINETTKMSTKDLRYAILIFLKSNPRGYLDQEEVKAVSIRMMIYQGISSSLYRLWNHLRTNKIKEMDSCYSKAARVSRILRRVRGMMRNSCPRRKYLQIIRIPRETKKKLSWRKKRKMKKKEIIF